MNKKQAHKSQVQQHLTRLKRILCVLMLAVVSACAVISVLYVWGNLYDVMEVSTLFAVYTAAFSILVPCCICLTMAIMSEPASKAAISIQPKETVSHELYVDLLHGELVYNDQHVRCREQILLILQYMTTSTDHFINKSDFTHVLNDNTYDCNYETANAKINTLVSSIRSVLKDFPYEIVNVNRRGYVIQKANTTPKTTE